MTIVEAARAVTGGIDTHGEVHVAAALDEVGGLLGTRSFGATPEGKSALLSWLSGFGTVGKVGVEGTGSYGAGLARFLARAGVEVIEVDRPQPPEPSPAGQIRPDRCDRGCPGLFCRGVRRAGRSERRGCRGHAVLVVAKRSARQARVKALTQMRQLTFTAPDQLQLRIEGLFTTVHRRGQRTATDTWREPIR